MKIIFIIFFLSAPLLSQEMLYVPVDKTDSVWCYLTRDNGMVGNFTVKLDDKDIWIYGYLEDADGIITQNNIVYTQKAVRPNILKEIKKRLAKNKTNGN